MSDGQEVLAMEIGGALLKGVGEVSGPPPYARPLLKLWAITFGGRKSSGRADQPL